MAKIGKKTVDEFLDYLTTIQGKAEYYNGEIFDMAGGTKAHGAIQTNVLSSFHAA